MGYLTAEIILYLLAAAALGLLGGWTIWGGRSAPPPAAVAPEAGAVPASTAPTGAEDGEGEAARLRAELAATEAHRDQLGSRLAEAEDARDALAAQRARLEERIEALEGELARSGADLAACRAALGAAQQRAAAPAPASAAPPAGLLAEPPAAPDDLKRIRGIGPVLERTLNEKGVYLFRQIAAFSPEDVAWVNEAVGAFPGRIERDDWVGQARALHSETYGRPPEEEG
jgi:predicted flap endonuclease-1-like 5' DNA nuclease